MAAGTEEYSWRYWRFVDSFGKSLIFDFNDDSWWSATSDPNVLEGLGHTTRGIVTNGGEMLLELFLSGQLHDGDGIRFAKGTHCYNVYGVTKQYIYENNIEQSQRYGVYNNIPTSWEPYASAFNAENIQNAYTLPENSVVVCGNLISGYQSCENVDPNQYNSIEIKNICTNESHFIKVDSFRYLGGVVPGEYCSVNCNDTIYAFVIVGFSMHQVCDDFCNNLNPDIASIISEEEAYSLCGERRKFVSCNSKSRVVTTVMYAADGVDITIDDLEVNKYFNISSSTAKSNCYKYVGVTDDDITDESIVIFGGPFDDCSCEPNIQNCRFVSCDGEHTIIVTVPNEFMENISVGQYYYINDMLVVEINGVLMKNCFMFDGFTSDETTCDLFVSKIGECDNTSCDAYILTNIHSCVGDYEDSVYVDIAVFNYLNSINCETFTYLNNRCVYIDRDYNNATYQPPLGSNIISISDIVNPKQDCEVCKNDLITEGYATCLVIEPCNTDLCALYISMQGMDESEINDLIDKYGDRYISFMYLGEEICGKVIVDCTSITDGLDPNRVIEPVNITGCYFSCESCYEDGEIPEPQKDDVKLGRKVEPNYEPNESYHSVCYDNCCCNTEEEMKELEECRRQNALLEERIAMLEQQLNDCEQASNLGLREAVCNAETIDSAISEIKKHADTIVYNHNLHDDETAIDDMYAISALGEYYNGNRVTCVERLNALRRAGGCEPFII